MYHYADGDVPRGPVNKEELRGRITPATLVWREGMADWLPASQLQELADLFASTGAAAATPVTPPTAFPPAPGFPQASPFPQAGPIPVGYGGPGTNPTPPGMATASMVLGIVGLTMMFCYFTGVVPGILAVVFGFVARKQGAIGGNPGAGQATAGIVMGLIPVALVALIMVFAIIAVIAGTMR